MTQVFDCRRCGAALSYGETFRHQLAQDVAGGKHVSKRILGDRLSPQRPQALCGACRSQAEVEQPEASPTTKSQAWLLPAAAAIVGMLLVAAVVRVR